MLPVHLSQKLWNHANQKYRQLIVSLALNQKDYRYSDSPNKCNRSRKVSLSSLWSERTAIFVSSLYVYQH